MDTYKILPDPDLHYGVQPEDTTDTIQKAPQRPRKPLEGVETEKMTQDTLSENQPLKSILERLIDFEVEIEFTGYKSSEGDGRTAADIERELALKEKE